ncbi:hypothetical protein CHCC14809_0746 [Bacillus licheniformis]|nr:hypothetical protein CHCC5024_1322 [Bacillus licheniformis]TWJ92984.1 hypothetical protein CHCC20493_4215 [Bacillus licheniformis]TWK11480.1 hypothetical protein CHCC20440_0605 [Bacillus licheniformis]TWK65672.1 hypothetical protein CHCC20341_0545 [Bacillus licheniformis]TWL78165.1 hypothetical protein CHCC15311_4181 [Bacillus licheniformis]
MYVKSRQNMNRKISSRFRHHAKKSRRQCPAALFFIWSG